MKSDETTTTRLRAGAMVRVINPRSEHYGNTGHVIGRSEQVESYWLVRFATTGDSRLMLEPELEVVGHTMRGPMPDY